MNGSLLRGLPIILGSLYACGMGLFVAISRPMGAPAAWGDPGAYMTCGLLGLAVLLSFSYQERRILELERQLRGRASHAKHDPLGVKPE